MKLKKLKWWLSGLVTLAIALVVTVIAILSSMEFQDLAEAAREEIKSATGRDLVIAGTVDLELSLDPAIVLEEVTFANAAWGRRDAMLEVRRFELEVSLFPLLLGDIEVKRLVLVQPDLLLEVDPAGRANWTFEAGDGETATGVDDGSFTLPHFEVLAVRGGRLVFHDARNGREVRLDLDRIDGQAQGLAGSTELTVKGRYNDAPFEGQARFDTLAALAGGGEAAIEMVGETGGSEIKLEGRVSGVPAETAFEGTVFANGPSLAALSPFLEVPLAALGPYAVSTRLDLAAGVLSFPGLTATLGGSDIAGNGELTLSGVRPRLKAAFVANVLSLEDFSGPASAAAAVVAAEGPDYVFPDRALPFGALGELDAEVKLTASTFRLPGKLALEELDLELALNAGRLAVEPLQAGLGEGRLEGRLDVDATADVPTVALNLEGVGLDYGRLLRDLDLDSGVQGVLDLSLAVTGEGSTPHAIAGSLNGTAQALSLEGVVNNRVMKVISVGLGDLLAPILGEEDNTRLNCLAGRFDLSAGRARSRVLLLDTPSVTLVGEGQVDLGREQLDLEFDTETREPSLASLTVPFTVTGSLREPQVAPDPLGAAGNLVEGVGNVAGTILSLAGSIGALVTGEDTASNEAAPCALARAILRQGAEAVSTSAPPKAESAAPTEAGAEPAGSSGSGGQKSLDDAVGDFTRDLKKLFD